MCVCVCVCEREREREREREKTGCREKRGEEIRAEGPFTDSEHIGETLSVLVDMYLSRLTRTQDPIPTYEQYLTPLLYPSIHSFFHFH